MALRFNGLVGLANRVRERLAGPLTAEHLAELQERVSGAVALVEQVLAEAGQTSAAMAAPSRRAYEFMRNVDFSACRPTIADGAERYLPGTVGLVGLTRFVDRTIADLSGPPSPERLIELGEGLASMIRNLDEYLADNDLSVAQLNRTARQQRAWIAYFARPENLAAYVTAVGLARPAFAALTGRDGQRPVHDVHVYFRPMNGLYRARGVARCLRIDLPTPMITFDEPLFTEMARWVFRQGGRREVVESATGRPEFVAVRRELAALAGAEDAVRGLHHDLAASFARVNAAYFAGALPAPRLAWSRRLTGRKFGHFDYANDTLMISTTLDAADVPASVFDFVMYHEMLHKALGVSVHNGRRRPHSPEFRAAERRFADYAAAEAALRALGAG